MAPEIVFGGLVLLLGLGVQALKRIQQHRYCLFCDEAQPWPHALRGPGCCPDCAALMRRATSLDLTAALRNAHLRWWCAGLRGADLRERLHLVLVVAYGPERLKAAMRELCPA